MNVEDITAIKSLLSPPQNIVIIPHKNPDGDAIGSSLALFHYLNGKNLKPCVIAPNDCPRFLKWMPGNEAILNYEKQTDKSRQLLDGATVIFTLDFNDFSRAGAMAGILERSNADFVMIDHHQQPADYAKVTYSDVSMSSTSEMVYNLMELLGELDSITKPIATNLYTGIVTDTGSFKHASTSSRTHRIAADLMEKGAENMEIHKQVFDTNPPSRIHLLGVALKNMVILYEFRTAYITLTQEELDANDFKKGDTEGFVNYGLTLEGIAFAAIFIENKDEGIVKISFRSVGDFSVNEFARRHFNGGGHTNAAGGRSDIGIGETVEKFKKVLKNYKNQLNV